MEAMAGDTTMTYELYIHVGMARTGSSFLQKNVFPHFEGVHLVKGREITHGFHDNVKNLLSSESLSNGDILRQKFATRETIAFRLQQLFPDANIIVVTREPESFIHSAYSIYLKDGGHLTEEAWRRDCIKRNPDAFNFEKYVDHLKELFPRVLHLEYEDFKRDNHWGIIRICDFMDIPVPDYQVEQVNMSLPDSVKPHWRRVNQIFKDKPRRKNPLHWYVRLQQLLKWWVTRHE